MSQHLFGVTRNGKQVGGAIKKIRKRCRKLGIQLCTPRDPLSLPLGKGKDFTAIPLLTKEGLGEVTNVCRLDFADGATQPSRALPEDDDPLLLTLDKGENLGAIALSKRTGKYRLLVQ